MLQRAFFSILGILVSSDTGIIFLQMRRRSIIQFDRFAPMVHWATKQFPSSHYSARNNLSNFTPGIWQNPPESYRRIDSRRQEVFLQIDISQSFQGLCVNAPPPPGAIRPSACLRESGSAPFACLTFHGPPFWCTLHTRGVVLPSQLLGPTWPPSQSCPLSRFDWFWHGPATWGWISVIFLWTRFFFRNATLFSPFSIFIFFLLKNNQLARVGHKRRWHLYFFSKKY